VGIALAPALDQFADGAVRLKWPNDVYVRGRKLAGILVEARWRDGMPEWVAIGVGINVRPPRAEERATGLRPETARLAVLEAVVPMMRAAAARPGSLDDKERRDFASRDLAVGRVCVEPVAGVVRGIDPRGALLVDVSSRTIAVRTGSLVLEEER
jgi:BirA family biotin operon repressor/biotin-[acetyl-CoA-carboxylase] ligase